MNRSETLERIRAVCPDESPIDLDEHARRIADVALDARRRAIVRAARVHGDLVSDLVTRLHDALEQPRATAVSPDVAPSLVTEGA